MSDDKSALPGTASQTGSNAAWDPLHVSRITSDDGAGADILGSLCAPPHCTSKTSNRLIGTGFGFSSYIPASATIDNVKLDVHRYALKSQIKDAEITLMLSGSSIGLDKKHTATDWPTSDYITRSYDGDLTYWGYSLTATDVRDSTFGAALVAIYTGATSNVPYVDYYRITITYTSAPLTAKPFWWIILLGWVLTQRPDLLALVAWGTVPRQHTVTRRSHELAYSHS